MCACGDGCSKSSFKAASKSTSSYLRAWEDVAGIINNSYDSFEADEFDFAAIFNESIGEPIFRDGKNGQPLFEIPNIVNIQARRSGDMHGFIHVVLNREVGTVYLSHDDGTISISSSEIVVNVCDMVRVISGIRNCSCKENGLELYSTVCYRDWQDEFGWVRINHSWNIKDIVAV